MSTTRNLLNRFTGSVRQYVSSCMTSPYVTSSASILLVGSLQLIDFICKQKIEHDDIDWAYYTDVPTRIILFALLSLIVGANLKQVIKTIHADVASEEDKISAMKILATSTAGITGYNFTQDALCTPINQNNFIYMISRSLANGLLYGPLMSSGGYFLQKLNYTIRPFNKDHLKFISAGIVISAIQEVLNYICDQEIDNDQLVWDSFVSPKRLLAWHLIETLIQGTIYGLSAYGLKKYSRSEDEHSDNHRFEIKFRNIILGVFALTMSGGAFIDQAMTVPINEKNSPYITLKSLADGIYGLVSGANTFVLFKLIRDRRTAVLRPEEDYAALNESPSPS